MTPIHGGEDISSLVLKSLKVHHLLGESTSQKLTYIPYLQQVMWAVGVDILCLALNNSLQQGMKEKRRRNILMLI